MPSSASFSVFGVSFSRGTRKLLNDFFIYIQAGIRRKKEDSHSVVEITVNCYV